VFDGAVDGPKTQPLAYPCRLPIKAMGAAEADFDALVVGIVRRYVPALGEGAVSRRWSRGGRYVSVTVMVDAESREQVDAIYRALTADARVLLAL
jgi:hypothetical protein